MLPKPSLHVVRPCRAALPSARTTLQHERANLHHGCQFSRCMIRYSGKGDVRAFRTSAVASFRQQQAYRKDNFQDRLRTALRRTRIQWAPIPVGLGICCLGALQIYRIQRRERHDEVQAEREELEKLGRPKKRERVRPSGPWSVQIMSTLPLKAISRAWGRFNSIDIPYYLRVPGFKLYSWIFGVNISEASEQDLHKYPNLAAFFYRTLKPGVRPLDQDPNSLLSPADGKVVQFGTIQSGGKVEQVKGVTYSLDALLGSRSPSRSRSSSENVDTPEENRQPRSENVKPEERDVDPDEEFARVNGISYTLPNLFSGVSRGRKDAPTDQSTQSRPASETEVQADFANADVERVSPWWAPFSSAEKSGTQLYYIVVYLAPGDYHRFHSPVSWVVSQRRHFAGELYSVSPYLVRTLPGLFTLNERVVLLGRWRWGFFSYTPVGATNVGSIIVNFDRELRTNSLVTDTAADKAAEEAQDRGEPYSGFAEATYESSSALLGGHALSRGEEMGGFQLGSTIVMVFEAPKGQQRSISEGHIDGESRTTWEWCVQKGQKVKVGEALGRVISEDQN